MKPLNLKKMSLLAGLFAGLLGITTVQAQPTSFTGSYSQNFDLALTNNSTTIPAGFAAMYLNGSHFTYTNAPGSLLDSNAIASAIYSSGTQSNTLVVWTYGSAVAKNEYQLFNVVGGVGNPKDCALGSDPTGTAGNVIQLALVNNSGAPLAGVVFSYTEKCMTNGTTSNGSYTDDGTERLELPGYEFFYSITGDANPTNWYQSAALSATNWVQGTASNAGPVTLNFPQNLPVGGVMYFRWADDNCVASSPDQMYAIDNIAITGVNATGPSVSLTSPANGANYITGSSVSLTASASESGGVIASVAFYSGSTQLATVTTAPYTYTWANVAAGSYSLTAVATDNLGLKNTSSAVNIAVANPTPVVSLTSPASGAAFAAGSTVPLTASASETGGAIASVAFYSGATLLGTVSSAPYTYAWANVAGGSYTLTATATDNYGASATSTAVSITVTNPLVTSFTGVYTQNFDLALSNSTTVVPAGFTAMYLPGSHFTYTNAPGLLLDSNAIAQATVGSGANALIVWPYGSAVNKASYQLFNVVGGFGNTNDCALGSDPTGTGGTVIQLALTNNTGSALTGVIFSYAEKCMTNGSTSNGSYTDDGTERLELPGYEFFYSITGDANPTNWYQSAALSATNWVQGTASNAGPVTLTFPQPLPVGGVMYFRWADDNCVASSPDQMYAIDNISIASANGPVVSITSPANNANYIPGTGITIATTATDANTNITSVSLFIDGSLAYTFTSAPYVLPIPGGEIPPGSYSVFAVAADAAGLTATSSVVNLTVAYVPPTVSLTSPANGSSFLALSSLALSASASSSDGTVTNVAFYQGSTLLGNATAAPFNYTWPNVPAGSYNLTALATDSHGLTATSSVVAVAVTNGYGFPVVAISSPANNANFVPGSNIAIAATATESGGTVTNVAFFNGATLLGNAATAPYNYAWANVSAGAYALTAVAIDSTGNSTTSAVVNITVSAVHVPPTVSLTSPANGSFIDVSTGLSLSATAASASGTVTNVAFYQNAFLVANVATAPYRFIWTNAPTGIYSLTAVATDNSGATTSSSAVNITATNSIQLATLQQIKTLFIIPLENHDLVQADPTGSPEQLLGNPACPYFNSLITPGNSNAVQTAWATHYFSCAINGEHPSEPNYVWAEAGTDFGVRTDNDPTAGNNQWSNVQHLSGQLTAAGIAWKDYQEDVQYSSSELVSASGSGVPVNPYNGTTEYNYAVKHNPMAFFTDTQNKNIYALTNFWTDLANDNVGRYNWITPDQYNEMHSSLPSGYMYNGVAYTGDQAAIAEGDNFLSIVIPKIMASQAYKDHGAIIIWTDETESTDDTNTTLPYVIISPLAKGNAYASTLPYSHSSDLKTMDELFGLAYQTNAIPGYLDAQNTAINYVNGSSAPIYDLSDFFLAPAVAAPALVVKQSGVALTNGSTVTAFGTVSLGANATETFAVTNPGSATLVLSNIIISGANAGDFTVSSLSFPVSLPAGDATSFNVVFAPSVAGVETATLQLSDNDPNNSPFILALTGTGVHVPPTVTLTGPANGASFAAPANLVLSATAADTDGTVTNVAFYLGSTLLANVTSAPYVFASANVFAGSYALTAVATDNSGAAATSSVVNVTITNTPALAVLQSIKTIFIIPLENHDLVQADPTGSPEQLLGNPACPYFNSLITPGNSNAVQTAYATHYFSCNITGEHPSEPNYVWAEAGTDFGVQTDSDPSAAAGNVFSNVPHLSGQLTAAGIAWKDYQEDVEYSSSELVSASGSGAPVNPYNGTTDYNYAVKHNPMAFFTDTQNKNIYPMTNFWADLANNNLGRYNWITPDQYNEMHSSLPNGFTYNGTAWTGNQAAIAEGDNFLSIVIPKIMASAAYQDHGVIIIWTDETESTDDTNTTLPYVILSPLAKGNAYASTLPYNHSSDLKTMDEIFGLAYQTNAIPATYYDSQNDGKYDYVDGHSATIYDLSDFFAGVGTDAPALVVEQTGGALTNGATALAFGAVNIGANATETFAVTNTGNGTLVLSNAVLTGANAGDFSLSGITLPATLYAGQGTSFNVVFAPSVAGVETATLQLSDNDPNNSPFILALTGTGVHVPPTVTLTGPVNGASFAAPANLALSATAADTDGTVTNVAFYLGSTLLANVTSAPYVFTTANVFAGSYALTAVATDNSGAAATSSVVNVTITNTPALAVLQSIKTVFVIAMENHDLVQKNPTGSPEQMLGNPAAPYFNSLITPGNPNAAQASYATHMFSCAINGEHPSEPNYIWAEAGTDFGIRTDNDPSASSHNVFTNVQHLSAQLTAAGIAWRSYQEDVQYSSSEEVSASGSGKPVNPYNGTTDYNYAVKHNPMAFFNDTQNQNCHPLTNFWTDLANNQVGRYNWITPDQYNEWHSSLPGGYTYHGTAWTGDQAAIAEGDNCLSIIIPKIMASAAYQDHGVIIIWTDETESTDDTNTTLPYVILSPLAKGNAYASALPYSHSSDLKTMDEIFGLAYQTNAIPAGYYDAQNDGKYDYVDGHSTTIYDLSDFFAGVPPVPPVAGTAYYSRPANTSLKIAISDLLTNVTDANGYAITLTGVGTDGFNLTSTNGTTLFTNNAYILYTNSVTSNVNDSFNYSVSDGHGGTAVGTVIIIMNSNLGGVTGQTGVNLIVSSTNITANFFGWPGFQYSVDRSTNLSPGVGLGWVPISTNTAPTNGLIQVQDAFQDLGIPVPPGPAAAYYRLRYNP